MTVVELPENMVCSTCEITKPITEFDKDSSKKTGYRSRCKTCRRSEKRSPAKPRPKKVATPTPEEVKRLSLRSEARRQAILRLIERHRGEFDRLVYSEEVRTGLTDIAAVSRSENWMSLI